MPDGHRPSLSNDSEWFIKFSEVEEEEEKDEEARRGA